MEFHVKLSELRKKNHMTQEQLAEKLFVSRTAVSKWESGKGYPTIESLKAISTLFSVSIDQLLCGDQLIEVAATENKKNIKSLCRKIFSIADLFSFACIIFPFYGEKIDGYIYSVSLVRYQDNSTTIIHLYWIMLCAAVALGIAESLLYHFRKEKILTVCMKTSMGLHIISILCFSMSLQPYAVTFLFLSFLTKIALLLKSR